MKLLTDEEIKECNYLSRNKAIVLIESSKTIKKDYDSSNIIAFTVGDKWKHSVLYNKKKDMFTCTCRWYTLKATPCAHIIAVNMWLKERDIKKKDI